MAVCAAGLLMLIAGRQVSVARAFVAGLPAAPGREASRKSNVARHGGRPKLGGTNFQDLTSKTDEELHELIAQGRKTMFEFSLEKFRKTNPLAKNKIRAQWEIGAAKTLLQQRKPQEEEAPVKTLTEAMATDDIPGEPTYNAKAANWEFWGRAQGCQRLRNTVPRNWWWIQQYRKTGQKDYNAARQKLADKDAVYQKDVKAYQATEVFKARMKTVKAEKTAQKAMPTQRSQDGQRESLLAGNAGAALGLSAAAAVFTMAGRRR